MNKRERLEAAIQGKEVDQIPASVWGHYFLEETILDSFVAATMRLQTQYDWDFIKIHPRASFCAEGFGFRYQPSTDATKPHTTLHRPVAKPEDWGTLRPVPLSSELMQRELEGVRRIKAQAGEGVPLIMTVFSPLDVADKLADRDVALMRRSIVEAPDALKAGLQAVTETFVPFVRALCQEGVDGIFFPTKWINKNKLSVEEYDAIAGPFDRAIMAEASGLWCNMVHLCEAGVDLAGMGGYAAAVLHWDDEASDNPTLVAGLERTSRAVSGGINPRTLANISADEVKKRIAELIRVTGGRRLIVAPGCTSHMGITPAENFSALREATRLS